MLYSFKLLLERLSRGHSLGEYNVASMVCAVHHAEVVAHKVGEPFGTLILAVAAVLLVIGSLWLRAVVRIEF